MTRKLSHHSRRLAVAAAVALVASACSVSTPGSPSQPSATQASGPAKTTFNIAYSTIDPGVPYFAGLVQGIKEQAATNGDTITTVTNGNFDGVKQGNDMADLVAQKPDAIMVTPISATQSIGWAANAQAAGIPVLATMSPVGPSYQAPLQPGVVGSLQVLPTDSGATSADLLAAVVPSGSTVGILNGPDGTATTPGFHDGFTARMKEKGDYTLVDTPRQPKSTSSAGLSACQAMIASNPEIKGIFSMSDEMTVGCIQSPNFGDRKIVGTGGTSAVLSLIKKGQVTGTTCWLPVEFGKAAEDLMHGILAGTQPQGTIKGFQVPGITADNLDKCPLSSNAS